MSTEEDFLRQSRMAALMAADADKGKNAAPTADDDALVSEKTKENLMKAGALAAVAGRWGFGKAKEATKAATEKAAAAKVEFDAKRAANAKRNAEEALAVEAKALAEREAAVLRAEESLAVEAKALDQREATVPVAEAPPMAVAPAVRTPEANPAADKVVAQSETAIVAAPAVAPDDDQGGGFISLKDASGFLTERTYPLDVESPAPAMESAGPFIFGETSSGMTSSTHIEVAEEYLTNPDVALEAPAPLANVEQPAQGSIRSEVGESIRDRAQPRQRKFPLLVAGVLAAATFLGLTTFYVLSRDTDEPTVTPAPVETPAAPKVVEPVVALPEPAVEDVPAPTPVETEALESPAAVAPPAAQAPVVAQPAAAPPVVPKAAPTPTPQAAAAPPEKKVAPVTLAAKPAPVKSAPVVVAKPKPVPKPAAPNAPVDTDAQLAEMEAWFEKQNEN